MPHSVFGGCAPEGPALKCFLNVLYVRTHTIGLSLNHCTRKAQNAILAAQHPTEAHRQAKIDRGDG